MSKETEEFFGLLHEAGWSQAEAARRLELTPSNISQYKAGSIRPSKQTLALLKKLLVCEQPDTLTARGRPEANYEEWELRFLELLRGMSDDDRDRAIAVLHVLVQDKPKSKSYPTGRSGALVMNEPVSSSDVQKAAQKVGNVLRARRKKPGVDEPNL